MAKTETAKTETAPKKKAIYVEPIVELTRHNDPREIDIPGWRFIWQNEETCNKKGWGHWRPVKCGTELGDEVARQFGITGDKFIGQNAENDYFYFGPDTILAYTSEELHAAHQAEKQDKADRALRSVGEDIGLLRNQVIIPARKSK